jgi:hypothetical protein
MISGRPETTTTTHFAACAQTLSIAAESPALSSIVCIGRLTPLSPGS